MRELSDHAFTIELQILWQNSDAYTRERIGNSIREYFNGDRAERIINKLQGS